MSRCVNDHTLWLLSEGQASCTNRAHVAVCADCAARYERLVNDLKGLKVVLDAAPPVLAARTRRRPSGMTWLTTMAATAAMLWLAWTGLWLLGPTPSVRLQEGGQETVWSLWEGVSETLFGPDEVWAVETVDLPFDLTDLQAALAGELPCEGQGPFWGLACEEDELPLVLGEQ
jgi:hypothetical protein